MPGVILYGPPASGKSTITAELERLGGFALFRPLKAGPGNVTGYRMTTPEHIADLARHGQIVWQVERYGATYAVDLPSLTDALATTIPVLNLGQPEAVQSVTAAAALEWLVVALIASRHTAVERLRRRGSLDADQRMEVWDATPELQHPDIELDTEQHTPSQAAGRIRSALKG